MKKLLLPALALALTACTPTLPNASAWLSPSVIELRRGASTEVVLAFVDRAGRGSTYSVTPVASTAAGMSKGISVLPIGPSIVSGNSGTVRFRVVAAPTAELGKHRFELVLLGKEGQLTQTLTVNITP